METIGDLKHGMEPCTYMDLPGLLTLGGGSPVLQALCLSDDLATLKSLRQVSRSVGEHALLALRKYTLTLEGGDMDTNVGGASLLQKAKLVELAVHLVLSDSYSPAFSVRKFVCMIGHGLCTVTHIDMHLGDTNTSISTSLRLLDAAAPLLSACPALQGLRLPKSSTSPMFVEQLGKLCPSLTTLDMFMYPVQMDCFEIAPYVQDFMTLQPYPLKQLNKLTLRVSDTQCKHVDLAENAGILTLVLHGSFLSMESDWLVLPPKLRHLCCHTIDTGPPANYENQTLLLPSLQSVTLGLNPHPSLHGLAQLFRAASAALQVVQHEGETNPRVTIQCLIDSTTAADLSTLHARMDLNMVKNAKYWFDCTDVDDKATLRPFIASLPCLTGIMRCEIDSCLPADVGVVLDVFPDLRHLILCVEGLSDADLSAVASCKLLETLTLVWCNVTTIGVAALSQRLPMLHLITCDECGEFTPPAQGRCVQLLSESGRVVEINELY